MYVIYNFNYSVVVIFDSFSVFSISNHLHIIVTLNSNRYGILSLRCFIPPRGGDPPSGRQQNRVVRLLHLRPLILASSRPTLVAAAVTWIGSAEDMVPQLEEESSVDWSTHTTVIGNT